MRPLDRTMVPSEGDIRAIENPISAMFDLSEDVSREAEQIHKMIRYSKVFIAFWLIVNFIIALSAIGNLIVSIGLFVLFIIGVLALRQLFRTDRFFKYYVMRHKAIRSVRDADPVVYIPQGSTSARRLMTYLTNNDKRMASALSSGKAVSKEQAMLKGKTGVFYSFDFYIYTNQSRLYRYLGVGEPGGAMYIKELKKAPVLEDLKALDAAIADVTKATRLPPRRVVLLWTRGEGDELDDRTYEHLTTNVTKAQVGRKGYVCSIQLVIENTDNTYEFIPFMADVA